MLYRGEYLLEMRFFFKFQTEQINRWLLYIRTIMHVLLDMCKTVKRVRRKNGLI